MKQLNPFQSISAKSARQLNRIPIRLMLLLFSTIFLNHSSVWAQCACLEGNPTIVGSAVNIPTLTVAMGIFPGFNQLNNRCVRISGQFRIDAGQTWEVNNSQLLFDANAEVRVEANSIWNIRATSSRMGQLASIRVQSLGRMDSRNSVFTNCLPNIRWGRIGVSGLGELQMDSCVVNLAITGVDIAPNAIFTILNSGFYFCLDGLKIVNGQTPVQHLVEDNLFYDCNIGINISGAQNVNIAHNTYLRNNIATMTGIYCATGSDEINIAGGEFLNQTYGINGLTSSDIRLIGASFDNCINGVNFFNGSRELRIRDNEFTNTIRNAIRVYIHYTANIQISENRIFTGGGSLMNSIYVANISGGACNITENNPVQIPGAPGVNGIEVFDIRSNATLNVSSNVVNQSGTAAVGGVLLNTIEGNTTVNNNVVTGNANMLYHIRATAVAASIGIQGNQLGLPGGVHANRGLELINNPGPVNVCCNQLSNSNAGLYITGPLNGAFIGRNTFNTHPIAGLFYDQVTSAGAPQILTGNDWRTYTGACPARFDGTIGMANATQYTVSMDLFPQLFAGVCTAFDPQEWFLIVADYTEATCALGGPCAPNEFNGGSEERSSAPPEGTLSIAPNPADQALSITFPISMEPVQVSLFDLSGRNLLQEKYPAENGSITLQTGHLPEGAYLLRCQWQNHAPLTQKVVIRH